MNGWRKGFLVSAGAVEVVANTTSEMLQRLSEQAGKAADASPGKIDDLVMSFSEPFLKAIIDRLRQEGMVVLVQTIASSTVYDEVEG